MAMHDQQKTQKKIPDPAIGLGLAKHPIRLKQTPAAAARVVS